MANGVAGRPTKEQEMENLEKAKAEMRERNAKRRKDEKSRSVSRGNHRRKVNKHDEKVGKITQVQMEIADVCITHALQYVSEKGDIANKEVAMLHNNMLKVINGEIKAVKEFAELKEFLKDAEAISNKQKIENEDEDDDEIISNALRLVKSATKE